MNEMRKLMETLERIEERTDLSMDQIDKAMDALFNRSNIIDKILLGGRKANRKAAWQAMMKLGLDPDTIKGIEDAVHHVLPKVAYDENIHIVKGNNHFGGWSFTLGDPQATELGFDQLGGDIKSEVEFNKKLEAAIRQHLFVKGV